ncbi:PQQ-binding-like beta-propeller repeat protein, partial [Streptomyces sp. G35A]
VVAAVVATAAVIAAVTATTLTVGRDTGASAPDDLPEGWRPWAAAAKGEPGTHPFQRCAATGTSLVCAGDDLMATRFALADGRTTWSRPVDPTPDDSGDNEGTVIGTRGGHVYVYGADQRETADDLLPTRYTVQALAADSGRVLWRTVTGDGESATAPNSEYGSATAIPEGVLTLFGPRGDTYALLDAEDGRVRWKQPLPKGPDACLLRGAAGRPYLLCLTGLDPERPSRTTLTRLDPDTGEARWRIEADGALDLLGQDRGRLVLAEGLKPGRALTLVDAATRVLTTVRLSHPQPEDADAHLERGTLYFTLSSGTVRAVSPHTGRRLWESNSTVEQQGPPTVSADRVYVASPSGRLAALDARTGKVVATRPGRDDGTPAVADLIVSGAPLVLVGDALYVPYGARSVYTVNTRDL